MTFREYIEISDITPDTKLSECLAVLNEVTSTAAQRYSVEVNYRTKREEALKGFAKIVLGYVSAAMKQNGYHVKHVFEEEPYRILVTSRNWDDGTWTAACLFNPNLEGGKFVLSAGFYNRDRHTITVQRKHVSTGDSAADLTVELRNMMHGLKGEPDKFIEKLKPVPLKRGPK